MTSPDFLEELEKLLVSNNQSYHEVKIAKENKKNGKLYYILMMHEPGKSLSTPLMLTSEPKELIEFLKNKE